MSSITFVAENRLVARGLEAQWEKHLHELELVQQELARREQLRPTYIERPGNGAACSRSARISSACGMRRPSSYETGSSCCEHCSRK
jgi:hypothetical protein